MPVSEEMAPFPIACWETTLPARNGSTMTTFTLASIEQALAQPFAPEDVKYLPKSPRQKPSGEWACLALPYADKRTYEDRLNDLAFGYWSTPYNPPYAIGNKLVVPVTVTLCDIEHTDYGEAFVSHLSRNSELHDAENSATVAYSQGFRRACAQFRLGRYLYGLPKVWVPYDPATKTFVLTEEQRLHITLRLYTKAGILLPEPRRVQGIAAPDPSPEPVVRERNVSVTVPIPMAPAFSAPTAVSLASGSDPSSHEPGSGSALVPSVPSVPSTQAVPASSEAGQVAPVASAVPPVDLSEHKRQWLERELKHNHERIARICEQYQVQTLDHLSDAQFVHLANRIFAAKKRAQQPKKQSIPARRVVASVAAVASVAVSSPAAVQQ